MINPTPMSLTGLMRWRDFWDRVNQLSNHQLEIRAEDICQRQEVKYKPLGRAVRKQLAGARAEDDLAIELVRVALQLRELEAFASYPTKRVAFKIESLIWDQISYSLHDVYRSIREGVLALTFKHHGAQSIERELINRPLFVNQDAAKRWLRIRPSPLADQKRASRELIQVFKRDYPRKKMKREDFIQAIRHKFEGLSREQAKRLWAEAAPAEWRRAGVKK